jgi:glycogen operon protein
MRNLFVTLMLSQGVPMIRSGDEIGHTQRGNNNAYCQDNEISWLNWELEPWQEQLRQFVSKITRLRAGNPVLRRRQFFQGRAIRGAAARDITWLTRDGKAMCDADWRSARARVLAMCLNGHIDEVDEHGQPIVGTTLLVLFNAEDRQIAFQLPKLDSYQCWQAVTDTAREHDRLRRWRGGSAYDVVGRSCVIFELRRHPLRLLGRLWTVRNGAPAETPPRVHQPTRSAHEAT